MCGRVVDQATTRRGPARPSHPDTQDPSEVLLSWSDVEERRVKTYKVDFSRDATAASRVRVNQCDECAPIVARMTLRQGSSEAWLAAAPEGAADVVYLDPMFPHRDKSALVKKEMQVFRAVVGDDDDAEALLAAALKAARYRVVVKRPRKAPGIAGPEPATRIEGKSSRYDLYPVRALPDSKG